MRDGYGAKLNPPASFSLAYWRPPILNPIKILLSYSRIKHGQAIHSQCGLILHFERRRYDPVFSPPFPNCNTTARVWCRNIFEDGESIAITTPFYHNSSESPWDLQACHSSNSVICVSGNGLRMKMSAQQSTVKFPPFKSQQRKTINLEFLLPPPNQLHKMAKLLNFVVRH